jgi:hypothetical protein
VTEIVEQINEAQLGLPQLAPAFGLNQTFC